MCVSEQQHSWKTLVFSSATVLKEAMVDANEVSKVYFNREKIIFCRRSSLFSPINVVVSYYWCLKAFKMQTFNFY